ncbi:MAG TPA: ROK family protein [Planctomycetaceae bacterium]|nr:ROK family protein [Planctomycetaceae bacterium]
MYLGIEIGGTKLQLGVAGSDVSQLIARERFEIQAGRGAAGILELIEKSGRGLLQKYDIEGIGIGFGGPVNPHTGRVTRSHQIHGWEDFPLVDWCQQTLEAPAVMGNDCDCATLAEARFGAGKDCDSVFYVTVGTGIGGGFAVKQQLHGSMRPAVAEIGHLRPGLHADRPDATVESLASGWGIEAAARNRLIDHVSYPLESVRNQDGPNDPETVRQRIEDAEEADAEYANDLLDRCDHAIDDLTAKLIGQAAMEGNEIAREIIEHAHQAVGWAVAQVITLLAPEMIVVGGGVSLMGEKHFIVPLRREVKRYVFPPLTDSYEIVPAGLGEDVVVYGALALAADMAD